MFSVLFLAVLWAGCLAHPQPERYSYSPAVGGGSGTSFASSGEERITGIRIWEGSSAYIYGIQVRYGFAWSKVFGRKSSYEQELELFDDEAIIQVSGKYNPSNYIYQLEFTTNRGRYLRAGQPTHLSFNFFATHDGAELRLLSGRYNGAGITSLGAHWGMLYLNNTSS